MHTYFVLSPRPSTHSTHNNNNRVNLNFVYAQECISNSSSSRDGIQFDSMCASICRCINHCNLPPHDCIGWSFHVNYLVGQTSDTVSIRLTAAIRVIFRFLTSVCSESSWIILVIYLVAFASWIIAEDTKFDAFYGTSVWPIIVCVCVCQSISELNRR